MAARIVRVITRLNVGGPSIQAVELSARLAGEGFETVLVHGRTGPSEGDMRYLLDTARPRPTIVELPTLTREISPLADAATIRAVYRVLCRERPAIVHTHMAKAGAVGRLAALAYNRTVGCDRPAAVVHTYHGHVLEGYFSPVKSWAFLQIERMLARATDRIVAVSPRIRDEILHRHRIGRADQHTVIPLGFDLSPLAAIDEAARSRAKAALGIDPTAAVVATVGRLTAIKNHRTFLDAAARLVNGTTPVVFVIAGDGELRSELETHSHALGLDGAVRFLGWRRDLTTIYGATDVFLLTSHNEGTPVALIESMAAGCAAVATDVGGVRDVVADDSLGRVVPAGDAAAAAEAVAALLDAPAARRDMGARARRHVLDRFNVERLVRDVAALYRELLARPAAR